jgi:large conductance mechanosensitive channel
MSTEKKNPPFTGFITFVREQGVVGLAVGLVIGTAVKSLVDSLVTNIVNPIIGVLLGGVNLQSKQICLNSVHHACKNAISWGAFISSLISFLVIAAVIYYVVHGLKLDKLDKKKDK